MGAGASTTGTPSVLDTIANCYREVHDEVERAAEEQRESSAVYLAQSACDKLDYAEEQLHGFVTFAEPQVLADSIDCLVYVGRVAGEESEQYLRCLSVAAGVLLATEDDLARVDEYVAEAYQLCNSRPGGTTGIEYARVLLNYYALRTAQGNLQDADWARTAFKKLLETNEAAPEAAQFGAKALRYWLHNLVIIHRENAFAPGANLFERIELDMFGPETGETNGESKGSDGPALSTVVSAPQLHLQTPTSVHSGGGGGGNFGFGGDEGDDGDDESDALSEEQALLFQLLESARDEDPAQAVAIASSVGDVLYRCKESSAIDTLTRCNEKGDTLLLAACRYGIPEVARKILEFGRNVRRNLDLTPQLLGAKNAVGRTSLHVACHSSTQSFAVADVLLSFGDASTCSATDRAGCTPLHFAASTGSSELVALLLLNGASPLQRDRQGYIPANYCNPDDLECFNLLFTPEKQPSQHQQPQDLQPTPESEEQWKRYVDPSTQQEYHVHASSGHIYMPQGEYEYEYEAQAGERRADKDLLALFTNVAWRLGLQGMLEKRERQAAQYAAAQAKAKLCLLEKGMVEQESMRRLLSNKDQSLEEMQRQLAQATDGNAVTQERLDAALSQLAEEREMRLQQINEAEEDEEEDGENEQKRAHFTEENVAEMERDLKAHQERRETVMQELPRVRGEIVALQEAVCASGGEGGAGVSAEQQARLDELMSNQRGLELVLTTVGEDLAKCTRQMGLALESKDLSEATLSRLETLLRKEEKLRLQALSRAAELEEENRRIQATNERLWREKRDMEAKLEAERRQLEQEARMREEQQKKLADAEREMGGLQGALEEEQRQREEARRELERIQAEMSDLRAKERDADAKALALQEKAVRERIDASEQEQAALAAELEKARQAKEAAASELSELQKKLEQERKHRAKAKRALEGVSKRLNSANEELSLLMKHLESEQKQRERAAAELAAVQAEMERLRQRHSASADETEEQARRAAQHAADLADREAQLATELSNSEADLARLNRELIKANLASAEAAEELDGMRSRLEAEREKRLDATKQLSSAKAQLRAIEDERRLETVRWSMERSQNERDKTRLHEQYKRMESQLYDERKSREAHEKDRDALRRIVEEKEAALQSERERAVRDSESKHAARQEAAEELAQLRAQLDAERKAREARDAELDELRSKNAEQLAKEKDDLLRLLRKEQEERKEAVERLAKTSEQLEEEKRQRKLKLDAEMEALQAKVRAEEEEKARRAKELEAVKMEMDALREQNQREAGQSAQEAARAAALAEKEGELAAKMRAMEEHMARLEREKGNLYNEFVEEQALRKQYYNEIEDLKGRIRVFCRMRPLSGSEKERGCGEVTKVLDEMHVLLSHPEEAGKRKKEDIEFAFDACFGPDKSQEDVFRDSKRLIQVAIDGYNVCLFAYGQTGSGKTYTLMGPENQPSAFAAPPSNGGADGASPPETAGIATRSVHELFRLMGRDKARFDFSVSMYVIELYKEHMIDLLYDGPEDEAPPLSVHLDPHGIVGVENITKRPVTDVKDTLDALHLAFAKRKITATKMNSHSSRSHLICSIIIEATAKSSGVQTNGKLTLVDLAGSERASKTGATGDTLKEAQAINKSLLALGDVIQALTTNAKHVPYRNHPLTQLMADSIGGNAKTLMFVNISPADYNIGETKESLRWATRVKQVTNSSTKNTESSQVRALRQQLEQLQKAQKHRKPRAAANDADLAQPKPRMRK